MRVSPCVCACLDQRVVLAAYGGLRITKTNTLEKTQEGVVEISIEVFLSITHDAMKQKRIYFYNPLSIHS